MINRIFGTKEKDSKEFLSYLEKFVLPECKTGNLRFFDDAQSVFVIAADRQMQIDVAAANEALLRDISVKRVLWLSEHFRNWNDSYYACSYDDKWKNRRKINMSRDRFAHLTDCQYLATLKLGTFTGNGYYRQQCMERLRDAEGSLPFLILRMNDWVGPIREKAYKLSQQRMQKCGLCEFFQSLPMLEKVRDSRRRADTHIRSLEIQAETLIRQKLQSAPNEALDEIHNYEIQIKNAVYRFINRNPVLKRERMERLLASERTGYGKMLLILAIFNHVHYDPLLAEQYLHSKSAVVRYHTLVYRYEQEHDAWPGLQAMLLDPSVRIRDYAAYILKKRVNMDVRAFYLKELERNPSKYVLSGVGEHGTKSDAGVIRPYLEDEREQICKTAIVAYGKLAGPDGEEIYRRFLFDPRPVIARQAYRCVQKYGISYGAKPLYEAYLQNRAGFMADYFLRLLLKEPSWARLPYLLLLYRDGNFTEKQRLDITAGICERHMYGSVSGQEAALIRDLLEQSQDTIPEHIRKGILFDLKCVERG